MDSKTLISITFRTNPFFSEILTDDIESAEVAVETALSPILMELFGGNIVTENVSVEYVDKANISKAASADRTQTIKVQVKAKTDDTNVSETDEIENTELAVEGALSPILIELFG